MIRSLALTLLISALVLEKTFFCKDSVICFASLLVMVSMFARDAGSQSGLTVMYSVVPHAVINKIVVIATANFALCFTFNITLLLRVIFVYF